jgi:hypothetical protein
MCLSSVEAERPAFYQLKFVGDPLVGKFIHKLLTDHRSNEA